MEKLVEFAPAYDKRPKYGIHGVELRMVLKGKEGAVWFVLYTNWQLPHVTEASLSEAIGLDRIGLKVTFLPLPADLGYHSPNPRYEGQYQTENCPYLDGRPCYYDGSGLNAQGIYEVLLKKGSDGVWKELEQYYREIFLPGKTVKSA